MITTAGVQLVWQQEDPVQAEHWEGSGGGEYVRGQGYLMKYCHYYFQLLYHQPICIIEYIQYIVIDQVRGQGSGRGGQGRSFAWLVGTWQSGSRSSGTFRILLLFIILGGPGSQVEDHLALLLLFIIFGDLAVRFKIIWLFVSYCYS